MKNTSQTIVGADSLLWDRFNAGNGSRGYYIIHHSFAGVYSIHPRHASAVNTLWVDGHASGFKVNDASDPFGSGFPKGNTAEGYRYWARGINMP